MFKKLTIPTYTSKDFYIMVATMFPMAIVLNYFLFNTRYFNNVIIFGVATAVTFILLSMAFLFYGFVAVSLRNRLPGDDQLWKRLAICIPLFILMSGVFISIVLTSYDLIDFFGYDFHETDFKKCFISFIVINIFLTFLHEGVSKFEKYKATVTETEQLKKEYMQSQLLGLKSQMNPHFLFNSLNTLSSLIQEDPGKAEDFLDHMSKVYRYLLRNNDEQLVSLETELVFIESYYFLLKARHTDGLHLLIDIPEEVLHQCIPPLTLQMILENAVNQNTVSKNTPLYIEVMSRENNLIIKNTIQPKVNSTEISEEGLENIANKFRLLCQQNILIEETVAERTIQLPLIPNTEIVAA
ncbi:sensor histidine kinase [Segetibacter koreensis]|uniref:sensor histidine kinase n=1 Tax=Segetibacter koreensis TaxID=398037 RepID=UPI00037583C9|nr:histidine kinase [Segetibacter koreensis]